MLESTIAGHFIDLIPTDIKGSGNAHLFILLSLKDDNFGNGIFTCVNWFDPSDSTNTISQYHGCTSSIRRYGGVNLKDHPGKS